MKKKRNYDSFIFTHIPKCGGTSFRQLINESALSSGVNESQIYVPGFNGLDNDKNLDQLSDKEKEKFKSSEYKVIAAHSKYNLHKDIPFGSKDPLYFTILRDPIKRFISHYHFFYYKLGYDDLKGVQIGELKMDKLIFLLKRLSNIQTNYLANFKFKKVLGEENLLKLAKYNLQHEYASFGILPELNESLIELKTISPSWLTLRGEMKSLNTSNSSKHEVPKKIEELIIEYNNLDIQLLAFAKKIKKKPRLVSV